MTQTDAQATSRPDDRETLLKEDPIGWHNTKWSCHVCGKYFDRKGKHEDHMMLGSPRLTQSWGGRQLRARCLIFIG